MSDVAKPVVKDIQVGDEIKMKVMKMSLGKDGRLFAVLENLELFLNPATVTVKPKMPSPEVKK